MTARHLTILGASDIYLVTVPFYIPQNCVDVLESLGRGDVGQCEQEASDYQSQCYRRFPLATAFCPHMQTQASEKEESSSGNPSNEILVNGSSAKHEVELDVC